jgi:hypothetical protein
LNLESQFDRYIVVKHPRKPGYPDMAVAAKAVVAAFGHFVTCYAKINVLSSFL